MVLKFMVVGKVFSVNDDSSNSRRSVAGTCIEFSYECSRGGHTSEDFQRQEGKNKPENFHRLLCLGRFTFLAGTVHNRCHGACTCLGDGGVHVVGVGRCHGLTCDAVFGPDRYFTGPNGARGSSLGS